TLRSIGFQPVLACSPATWPGMGVFPAGSQGYGLPAGLRVSRLEARVTDYRTGRGWQSVP
ncbi:MAG: hypothetical protein AAFR61_32010, partial [Bacteroidota bacterium]